MTMTGKTFISPSDDYIMCRIPCSLISLFLKIIKCVSLIIDILIFLTTLGKVKFVASDAVIAVQSDISQNFVSKNKQYTDPIQVINDDVRICCQIINSIPFLIISMVLLIAIICSLLIDILFFLLTIGRVKFVIYNAFTALHFRISEDYKAHGFSQYI